MNPVMKYRISLLAIVALFALGSPGLSATELKQSYFEQELQKTRYASLLVADEFDDKEESESKGTTPEPDRPSFEWEARELSYERKSPTKAFLLSLAVPGAGQYYYGSKKKGMVFFGIEAVSWMLYLTWHGDGNDLTDDFRKFQTANWTRQRYVDYLEYVHGVSSDSNINEFVHNLPPTNSQQYYEMTGKYDQFVWGWGDTRIQGGDTMNITEHINAGTPIDQLILTGEPDLFPTSEKRLIYEEMRLNANNKFDQAQRALYVTVFNHLISAFEAFVTTRSRNNDRARAESEFARLQVRAKLKSIYASRDTPFLNLTYRF